MVDAHSSNIPENIKVLVRVRPFSNDEIAGKNLACTSPDQPGALQSYF